MKRPIRRSRLDLAEYEKRVLEGDLGALRPLVRQATGPNTLHLPFRDVELKAKADGTGGTRLAFTGYASVTEAPFLMWDWAGDYEEVVNAGAFKKTLEEVPDVVFCLNHDWDSAPMARTKAGTLRLSEDDIGLWTEADLDGKRADVYQVQSAMEAGELDAMSFAFYVTRQTWSPDYSQRNIVELDMDGGDASVVTHPANPATTGTVGLRARAGEALVRSRVPMLLTEAARAERRAGKALSAATVSTLSEVLDLVAAADVGMDSAQALLAELLGVDNPDDDGAAGDGENESQAAAGPDPEVLRMRAQAFAAATA